MPMALRHQCKRVQGMLNRPCKGTRLIAVQLMLWLVTDLWGFL